MIPCHARNSPAWQICFVPLALPAGEAVYAFGETLDGLYLIRSGRIEIHDRNGALVSLLGPRNSFGERGLLRDGKAATSARVAEDAALLLLPAIDLQRLIAEQPAFARFFSRLRPPEPRSGDLTTLKVSQLMTREPVTCTPDTPVAAAAKLMRDRGISSICVAESGKLAGILTTGDLAGRVVAEGLSAETPVRAGHDPRPADPHARPAWLGYPAPHAGAPDRAFSRDRARQARGHRHPDRSHPFPGGSPRRSSCATPPGQRAWRRSRR